MQRAENSSYNAATGCSTLVRTEAVLVTKASMLAEFFFALAIGSGMSCVP